MPEWNQYQIEMLCAEVEKGISVREIAENLSEIFDEKVSYSSIIGKCDRLGLSLTKGISIPRRTKNQIKAFERKKLNEGKEIYECRYIVKEAGMNSLYCNEPIVRHSYCEEHYDLCYITKRMNEDGGEKE